MTPPALSLPFLLRRLIKLFWSEADRGAKQLVVTSLLLALASSVVSSLAPVVLTRMIDVLESRTSKSLVIAPLTLVLIYAVVHISSRSLSELRDVLHGRTDQRLQRQISHRLFQHVMSLPLRFHLEFRTGAVSQILANGLMGYSMVLNHVMITALPIIVELATIGAVLLLLGHAVFLVIVAASVVLYAIVFSIGVARVGGPARAVSNAKIRTNARFVDSILNYETIKYLSAEPEMQIRFSDALKRNEDCWNHLYIRKMENGLLTSLIFATSLGLVAYVAARKVLHGGMTIGEFVLVNAYILQIAQPLERVGLAFRDIAEGKAWIARMDQLLDHEPEVAGVSDSSNASILRGAPEIVFDKVSYAYRAGRTAVTNITLMLPSAKTVAIVGSSGCGKSSLIRLLMRVVEPTEGTIYVNGVPLADIPICELRKAVAVVPQQITLFDDSIGYNIGIGKEGSSQEEIVEAAHMAELHDFISRLPNGYRTRVGERGLKLSGGERQRIAIARAAIRQPIMFIFDEGTSSLDLATERVILRNLMRRTLATTRLIIAHRLSTIVDVDEIVVMNGGAVVECGSHDDLVQRNGMYAALWHAQRGSRMVEGRVSCH